MKRVVVVANVEDQ